jgi:hypothetical protein
MPRYILVTCYGNNFRNCPFSVAGQGTIYYNMFIYLKSQCKKWRGGRARQCNDLSCRISVEETWIQIPSAPTEHFGDVKERSQ